MENLIRIIIIEDNLSDAETLISTIKSGGWAVRTKRAEDAEDLLDTLGAHSTDIVLYTLGTQEIDLEKTVDCIREAGKHIPVIAVSSDKSANIAECMLLGAEDLVYKSNPEHLKLAVYRTYKFQQQWRKLRKLEVSITETEKRCRTLLDSSRDSICYVHEGMHVYANDTYLNLLGYDKLDEIEGLPVMDLVASGHQQTMKQTLRHLHKVQGNNERLDIELQHANGKILKTQMEFSPASIDGEECTQIVIRNQGNTRELEQQLKQLSQRDISTGLYNRAYFVEQLEGAINRATQGEHNYALVQLQICNIQDIKGLVGPAATDTVVTAVAKTIKSQCEKNETLARFGEESFALLRDHHTTKDLKSYLDEILCAVNKQIFEVDGKSVSPRLCIGVVQIDENSPDINEILLRVENTVEQSKVENDQNITIYIPTEGEMTQKQKDKLWKSKIEEALQNDQLRLVYQPIIGLNGDSSERYETYIRLLDERGQEISATEFLPSAERTGISKDLDRWLITRALNKLKGVIESSPQTILFIKLTVGTLQDPQMLSWLSDYLKKVQILPENLVFEIKEEVIITHLKQAIQFTKGLNRLNCQFAVDGFGTGLKPFQLMKAMPIDYLRIDESLMREIGTNSENQEAVRTINETARIGGQKTITPFVEDAAALSVLWSIGVNYIQGNFLREPGEDMDFDFSSTI
ncbi:MAG: EAL domain-containing protein [Gammaproteobacteria bacterium]|nr:EAL domain-containing protein [Gammaproteobacteria bacterium]